MSPIHAQPLRFSASLQARRCAWALWCILFLNAAVRSVAGEALSREDEIKAGFLYNFTKFVEWPATSLPDKASPLVIGVYGKEPFTVELKNLLRDRTANGRSVVVKEVLTAEAAREVHVLFFRAAKDSEVARVLAALERLPVLTVGESEEFRKAGGAIHLVREHDRIHFEINMDSAQRAGVKISAHLQKFAKTARKTN